MGELAGERDRHILDPERAEGFPADGTLHCSGVNTARGVSGKLRVTNLRTSEAELCSSIAHAGGTTSHAIQGARHAHIRSSLLYTMDWAFSKWKFATADDRCFMSSVNLERRPCAARHRRRSRHGADAPLIAMELISGGRKSVSAQE